MEEEASSSSLSMEDNKVNIDIDMDKRIVDATEVRVLDETETETAINAIEKVEDPKVGMLFDSVNELVGFYKMYGQEKGFGVSIRTSKKGSDGKLRYVTIACSHMGKHRIRSSNPLKLRPQSKTDCKAKLSVVLCPDGKWMVNSMILDHNHGLNPDKVRFYRCHRTSQLSVKRMLEKDDIDSTRVNKSSNPFGLEIGGHEHLRFLEKDCRDYTSTVKYLQFRPGDAAAMQSYFLKMKLDNSAFFYSMDFGDDAQLRNVFWVDARSRAAFKEFGDVVAFDTTYLINKYVLPFAPFIGVNHHGQQALLGCALISSEDTRTFTWLFETWLASISGCPPSAMITAEDRALKNATEMVFPSARHRWCLSHIMKKLPEKLKGYKQYESIKICMQNVVYDSISKGEFEESWGRLIENYNLESNEWLLWLYEERHRWVPAFVKDTFWAGMSTTQRNESMRTFFDGHVNSKTTLKQFTELYENVLAKKVENEYNEECSSFNSCLPCITPYEMEKQFQSAYTTAKFKEFQQELIGKIYCNSFSCKESASISEYAVGEDVSTGESHRRVTFNVLFNQDTNEVNCDCCLFEYRGILCRHQIVVLHQRAIYRAPNKYILPRWSKAVRRRHTRVRISYDKRSQTPEVLRFEKTCNAFHELADMARNSEERWEKVVVMVNQLHEEMKGGGCLRKQ